MIACVCCFVQQKECQLSTLFKRYEECIHYNKKCISSNFVMNFDFIDYAVKKLKRDELKTKMI